MNSMTSDINLKQRLFLVFCFTFFIGAIHDLFLITNDYIIFFVSRRLIFAYLLLLIAFIVVAIKYNCAVSLKRSVFCPEQQMIKMPVISEDDTRHNMLKQRFYEKIVQEKVFLQPNLRMDEVAILLHSNRTYISEMINSEFDMNYSSYINYLRINYAKELMMQSKRLKQEELASICGFPNAAAFNRVFKQNTGYPPKAWLNKYDLNK